MQYAVKMQQKASEQLFFCCFKSIHVLAKQLQAQMKKTDPLSLFKNRSTISPKP